MKTISLLSLLLVTPLALNAPSAKAQDNAAPAIAPVANRQISLTLAKGQPALVRDRRTVSLPAGRALLRFPGVPSDDLFDKDSLQVSLDRAVTVLRQENGSLAGPGYGLSAFVGKQVTLLRPQGSAGEKAVSGTLLSAGTETLLETPDGVLLNPPGVWVLPRIGKENLADSGFRGVQWQVEAARAGDFAAEVFYATSRLGWNARYTATLSPARDRLNLRGWLAFDNQTQSVFAGADLALRDANGVAFVAPRAATLNPGETQLAYVAADVPVTESLIYAPDAGRSFTQAINGAHPQRSMTLENSVANGLGVYLPSGSLSLWQGEAGKTLRLDKTANWGAFSPGDIISVPLGANESISLDRFIVSSKLLNPVTREIVVAWKVTAQNGAPPVTVIDTVPPRFKLTGATLKPVAVANNQLRFEVNVPNQTPVEFRYTVEVPA